MLGKSSIIEPYSQAHNLSICHNGILFTCLFACLFFQGRVWLCSPSYVLLLPGSFIFLKILHLLILMFVYEQCVRVGSTVLVLWIKFRSFRHGNIKYLYQLSWLTDSNFYFFLCHKLDYKANVTLSHHKLFSSTLP